MATLLLITGFALLVMETLIGMVANGFIVLISCIEWTRSRKLSLTDLILTCLALARLAWQAIVILDVTMYSFFLHTYLLNHVFLTINMVWFFTYNTSLSFAACLSILYFVKITTFSHPIFLQAKQRFSGLLPWLLLGSVAFSAFMTMTITVITVLSSGLTSCDPYKLLFNNSFDLEIKNERSCTGFAISVIVPNVIPSVIFLSSTILLIISLWKHTRHMQHNGISTTDLNTSVHLTAIKTLTSFAILYLSSSVAIHLQILPAWRIIDRSTTNVLFEAMSAVYPSGHAVVLILINPKLKQAWVRMMHHLKCHDSEAPSQNIPKE